jgi:SH3 domain protein
VIACGEVGSIMKYAFLLLGCLLLTVTTASGETKYVTDVFEVMIRTGPNLTNKILAMPKSGTPIEILESPDEQRIDDWVKVRFGDDKEGWMLSQFLIPGPPKKDVIARLESDNRTLKQRAKTLAEENVQLKKERKELGTALTQQTTEGTTLKDSYETLKRESKDFLALKAAYDKASQELKTKTKQVGELQQDVEGLRNSQTLRWFVAGASIILVGFIIGYVSRRPKRRSSLL